jgi:hypothetical protein
MSAKQTISLARLSLWTAAYLMMSYAVGVAAMMVVSRQGPLFPYWIYLLITLPASALIFVMQLVVPLHWFTQNTYHNMQDFLGTYTLLIPVVNAGLFWLAVLARGRQGTGRKS